uniref:Mnn9p n=1 Tax=Yarrowia lipolytica TaxID=4952 RepID=Q8X1X9_YARLL|nr:Mnn9p [Yarrowia lipolytica]
MRSARRYLLVLLPVVALLYVLSTYFRGTPVEKPVARNMAGNHIVKYNMNKLQASSQAASHSEKVLILTPLARFYDEYWENLVALSYPHDLISLGFIVPRSKRPTGAEKLDRAVAKTQKGKDKFSKVTILRQEAEDALAFTFGKGPTRDVCAEGPAKCHVSGSKLTVPVHQWPRHMQGILWLNSNVVETPHTLIQDMTKHDKDVLVANCYQRYTNDQGKPDVRPYDYNSWVESQQGIKMAESMSPDDIILEGYGEMATYRLLMAKIYNADGDIHEEIALDGVGGTALLVKSEVHRDGAMFPPFPFYHLIETEGFAKMAKRLGYKPYGLPNYLVYHYNE